MLRQMVGLRVRAARRWGLDSVCLYLLQPDRELNVEPEPVAILDENMAQQLVDDLWAAGIRPTEGTGSAGALAATQAHLQAVSRILDVTLTRALRKSA